MDQTTTEKRNAQGKQIVECAVPTSSRIRLGSIIVGVAVFVPLLVAVGQLALGWDEGYTFRRQDQLCPWLRRIVFGDRAWSELFTERELDAAWHFSREEPDGHGPFYALLSLAGHGLTRSFLSPPASYRVAGIALFALTVSVVYATLRSRWSVWSALLTAGLLATTPRLVPEVCYALIDGPLLSLALLAWCAFVRAVEDVSKPACIGFGLAIGLAMATKLTGWFLPLPYLIWGVLDWYKSRQSSTITTLSVGAVVALVTVFAVNVGWWPDPVEGVRRYFVSNLTRAETIPIATMFWGVRYEYSLPWYNTLVWTAIAEPVGTFLLGTVGVLAASYRGAAALFGQRSRWPTGSLGVLLLANWGLLMVVRALPWAPGHDGTRQIIVSFGFLALLAGYALETCILRQRELHSDPRQPNHNVAGSTTDARSPKGTFLAAVLAIAAVGESAWSTYRYHPTQLSYYSPVVGGLPGAARLGFEPTYFWDAATWDVIDWINRNSGPGEQVLFRNYHPGWEYLTQWGYLKAPLFRPGTRVPPRWFVMQHRPGIYLPSDMRLVADFTPAIRKEIFGVPLLSIYTGEEFLESRQMLEKSQQPD